jgi:molecular chaperone DnaK
LFRLLTSKPPFLGDTIVQTLLAHRTQAIPSLCSIRPDIPTELDIIVRKMLAKKAADRYQTMNEVVAAFEKILLEIGEDLTLAPPAWDGTEVTQELDSRELSWSEGNTKSAMAGSSVATTLDVRGTEPTRTVDSNIAQGVLAGKPADVQAIGIDLGTTFSALAHLDSAGRPQLIENVEGDKITPSVVLFDEHEVVVGREAVKAMGSDFCRIAECMKRDMGHREYRREVNGKTFPPEVLQAWVLRKLKQDAQRMIGDFEKVVITVPAYFDEVRRKATQDAGFMAGLDVIDIINEPTAAALAFGYQRGQLLGDGTQAPKRVLVYDLGGGTFDVTIMEIGQGEFVTLGTDGDVQLGGRDWDERLLEHVAESFMKKHGIDPREDSSTYGRLLRDCEDAKRTLSLRQKATIPCDFRGYAERVEVSREKFEEFTADLLERTTFTTRQTLKAVGLDWHDIDSVLLVGGSTRMPAVVRMLRTLTGKDPDTSISPDEAVAHGAAIHAGLVLAQLQGHPPRIRVRNVNSHSLGIVATDPTTKRRQNAVLVPRNTPLPAKAKRVFRTFKEGQKSIVAHIVEGESPDPVECMQIGKCIVRNLPDDLPAGTPIEVKFQYEANGRVQVIVNVAGRQENVTHELARENNLSPDDLATWRKSISSLA